MYYELSLNHLYESAQTEAELLRCVCHLAWMNKLSQEGNPLSNTPHHKESGRVALLTQYEAANIVLEYAYVVGGALGKGHLFGLARQHRSNPSLQYYVASQFEKRALIAFEKSLLSKIARLTPHLLEPVSSLLSLQRTRLVNEELSYGELCKIDERISGQLREISHLASHVQLGSGHGYIWVECDGSNVRLNQEDHEAPIYSHRVGGPLSLKHQTQIYTRDGLQRRLSYLGISALLREAALILFLPLSEETDSPYELVRRELLGKLNITQDTAKEDAGYETVLNKLFKCVLFQHDIAEPNQAWRDLLTPFYGIFMKTQPVEMLQLYRISERIDLLTMRDPVFRMVWMLTILPFQQQNLSYLSVYDMLLLAALVHEDPQQYLRSQLMPLLENAAHLLVNTDGESSEELDEQLANLGRLWGRDSITSARILFKREVIYLEEKMSWNLNLDHRTEVIQ